jgi:geranylgeranylglycerol-phosphate geranylgeranyltransferase
MVGFAVLVGIAVLQLEALLSVLVIPSFLTGFLISSYSMVINDIYDIDSDRVNQPSRPLPSGSASLGAAKTLAAALLASGIASSLFLGPVNFTIALLFALLSWLYSAKAKSTGLAGNSIVAASLAIPYIFGGAAVAMMNDPLIWFLALISFLAGMGREIVKTITDVLGDTKRGIRSVTIMYGPRTAGKLGGIFFLAAVASTPLPLIFSTAHITYGLLVSIPVIIFIYLAASIMNDPSEENARRVKSRALAGMLLGLLAFIMARGGINVG